MKILILISLLVGLTTIKIDVFSISDSYAQGSHGHRQRLKRLRERRERRELEQNNNQTTSRTPNWFNWSRDKENSAEENELKNAVTLVTNTQDSLDDVNHNDGGVICKIGEDADPQNENRFVQFWRRIFKKREPRVEKAKVKKEVPRRPTTPTKKMASGNSKADRPILPEKRTDGKSQPTGRLTLVIPKDRCKPGVFMFGDTKCHAMNKGWGVNGVGRTTSGVDMHGNQCSYKAAPGNYQSGGSSLPGGRSYNLTLNGDKGKDSGYYKRGMYGPQPPVWLGGGLLQIHSRDVLSNSATLDDLDNVYSSGCIIVGHQCMKAINSYLKDLKAKGKKNWSITIKEEGSVDYDKY